MANFVKQKYLYHLNVKAQSVFLSEYGEQYRKKYLSTMRCKITNSKYGRAVLYLVKSKTKCIESSDGLNTSIKNHIQSCNTCWYYRKWKTLWTKRQCTLWWRSVSRCTSQINPRWMISNTSELPADILNQRNHSPWQAEAFCKELWWV